MLDHAVRYKKKQTSDTIITRLNIWDAANESYQVRPESLEAFKLLLRIKQGEKRKRCHKKSDFRLWQATHFSTKNPINKPAVNNRRLLIAAVFHFVHPVEKDIKKHHKLTQNYVSFGCQSKQVSRCCINFPQELTCQIVTNQNIKIGRRAWPTRNHGKKRSSPPVFLKNWLNFRVRGKFEIKILIVLGHGDVNTTFFI